MLTMEKKIALLSISMHACDSILMIMVLLDLETLGLSELWYILDEQ